MIYPYLLIIFLSIVSIFSSCRNEIHGGQCVAFARKSFGSSPSQMPGLCKFSKDCGAYNAYDHWDLGYGRGKLPSSNSLLVLSKQKDLPFGHIARVNSVSLDSYGNYHLMVD